jgi:hypothetical protein
MRYGTKHGEIDDTVLQVKCNDHDTGVRDNNYHDQDNGVFDGGDDHDADDVDDDDAFFFEELLHHVEPRVLSSMGTHKGLDNMEILDKS